MKITVVKEFSFDAAHHLPGYNGMCANVHGHHYILQIGIKGEINDDIGMVIDFSELKKEVNDSIISHLDHQNLNELDVLDFPNLMPTAENMVGWIVEKFQEKWYRSGLVFVRLYETPTSYVEWRAE